MNAANAELMADVYLEQSNLMLKYGEAVDRESAYERIEQERARAAQEQQLAAERAQLEKERAELEAQRAKEAARQQREAERQAAAQAREQARREEQRRRQREQMATEAVGTLLSPVFGKRTGKKIARGLFGTLK